MANNKIGLTAFGLHVAEGIERKLELHNISGRTLIDILYEYAMNNLDIYENDQIQETVFTFSNINKEVVCNNAGQAIYEILYGIVKTGEYGIESELINNHTGNVSYNRQTDDADVMPFGFSVFLPAGDVDNSIILFQSTGRYGMKTVLQKNLKKVVRQINASLSLELGVIVPKIILDRYLKNGCLQKIRLIRYGIPNDVADRYGLNYGVEDIIEERVIRNPVGFWEHKKDIFKQWRRGDCSYSKIIQIEDFVYDDFKMEFKMGSRNKTISLGNIDKLNMCEDITDDVMLQGGHPTLRSLLQAMKESGEFYMRAKGLISDE